MCNNVAGDVAKKTHDGVVLLDSLIGIGRGFGMIASLGIVLFPHSHHLLHIGVMEIEGEVFVIEIEVHIIV